MLRVAMLRGARWRELTALTPGSLLSYVRPEGGLPSPGMLFMVSWCRVYMGTVAKLDSIVAKDGSLHDLR